MVVLSGSAIGDWSDDKGNRIIGRPKRVSSSSRVGFFGSGGTLTFSSDNTLDGTIGFVRDGASARFGRWAMFNGRLDLGLNCHFEMGDVVYCGTDLQVLLAEGTTVTLGNDLLISDGVRIRTDDSHPIYDAASGERVNHSRSVTVGDHVWFGQESFVLPGSVIPFGCVVGARSVVSPGEVPPERSVLAGAPARVVREGVHWTRQNLRSSNEIASRIDPVI